MSASAGAPFGREELFEELADALADLRNPAGAELMAQVLLNRSIRGTTLVGLESDGERAIYHLGLTHSCVAVPFDADRVAGDRAEVLVEDVESADLVPQECGYERFGWMHPRVRPRGL